MYTVPITTRDSDCLINIRQSWLNFKSHPTASQKSEATLWNLKPLFETSVYQTFSMSLHVTSFTWPSPTLILQTANIELEGLHGYEGTPVNYIFSPCSEGLGNMEMEKWKAMSMAVSKRPVCTSKATTSSALPNGPAGHAQYNLYTLTRTHYTHHTHTHTCSDYHQSCPK